MKKAKLAQERDVAVDRVDELEATIERLRGERSANLVELSVADATIDAARARIAALEHTCENLTQRIAMAERERDLRRSDIEGPVAAREAALREELANVRDGFAKQIEAMRAVPAVAPDDSAFKAAEREIAALANERASRDEHIADLEARAYAAQAERDALVAELAASKDDVSHEVERLESRVASLVHARERLFAGSVRVAEARANLDRELAERSAEIEHASAAREHDLERLQAEHAELIDAFAAERAERVETIDRLDGRRAKLEYDLEAVTLRLAATMADHDRLKTRSAQTREELERANASLEHTAEIIRSLALAHHAAAETIASLELQRVRLEYDLAARVGAAESNAAQAAIAASRLREDRTLLLETIALRERRIAILESTIREIATDMIRSAEAERERYAQMHHALLASKIVRVRDALRRLLGPSLALRARLSARVSRTSAKRRPPRTGDKRPRHLRSA